MEDEKFLEEFPVLTGEDIQRINAVFKQYVFYTTNEDGGRDCECTSCGEAFHVEGLPRIQTPEWKEFMGVRHNQGAKCPKCGRRVTLKNRGSCKTGKSLDEWRRVILLHVRDGEVYAQAAYIRKQYFPGCWRPEVEWMPKAMYVFRPGEAVGWRWRHDYTFLGVTSSGNPIQEGWERMKNVCEPWPSQGYSGFGGYYWNGYHVIGQERLEDSFLRYCWKPYLEWRNASSGDGALYDDVMRYLAASAVHPQIEMLLKMGLRQIAEDVAFSKKKLSREIRWNETDPRKAFGLTSPELKVFCAIDGSAEQLRWYKRLKKGGVSVTFNEIEEIDHLLPPGTQDRFFRACATGCGVKPGKAIGYIKSKDKRGLLLRDGVIQWVDYVEAAKYCGYDLDKPLVLMPKRLKEAHDGAVETELRLRSEREMQDDSPYMKRFHSLMERYGFSDGAFFIRAPSSGREIIAEGNILEHCVGRYAGDHAKGKTTILFMRRVKKPFMPAWTIEIKGDHLIQVQGEKDLGSNKPKGRAAAFLRRWLEWVKAGSRRDKAGEPVEQKMEGAKTA